MSIFAKMLGLDPEAYLLDANNLFEKKFFGEAKLEYEKAMELFASDSPKLENITNQIIECKNKLSDMHLEWADSCVEGQDYEKAMDEYLISLGLLPEDHANRKDIKRKLDETKKTYLTKKAIKEAKPFILRGEEFLKEKHLNGALVEFQQAMKILKFLSDTEEIKKEVIKYMHTVEEAVVDNYIKRGESLLATNLFDEAIAEFEKARTLISVNIKLGNKIDKYIRNTIQKRGETAKGADNEFFISKEEWDKALGHYTKLLEKYFQYTYEDSDPYKAFHMNKFEKEFKEAKTVVGSFYIQSADGYFNLKKFGIAMQYYVEAKNFYEENDNETNYLIDQINQCKKNI